MSFQANLRFQRCNYSCFKIPKDYKALCANKHFSQPPTRKQRQLKQLKQYVKNNGLRIFSQQTDVYQSAVETDRGSQAKKVFNTVFVSTEVAPYSKTGGLGDVVGSLPLALARRGHRVCVIAPYYTKYEHSQKLDIELSIFGVKVGIQHIRREDVDFLFIEHESFQRSGLYGDSFGVYGDNQWRYMILQVAALEIPLQVKLNGEIFGQDVVFMCNDWQTSLIPVYLASKYRPNNVYKTARSILAIHNLKHQGVYPPYTFKTLNIPHNWYPVCEFQYPPHRRQGAYEEEGRSVNSLKAGITTADRIVTVSPSYAGEIQTVIGGCDLEALLQTRRYVLNGILNGIDLNVWNPEHDNNLFQKYNIFNYEQGKAANKQHLQRELNLPQNSNIPLIGFIGRLDFQKGADLILQCVDWMMSQDVQLVCLGSGDTHLENGLRDMDDRYKDKARGWVGFNVPLSHMITAGADILVMPSRFEPCGLNQMYAMRYGTVPVAHETGGLKDTVINYDTNREQGTGWTFQYANADGLIYALTRAIKTFREDRGTFKALQERGMNTDYSWNKAAEQYEQIFQWAKVDPPYIQT